MKREFDLIEKIADPDNLRLAFYKARKRKDAKKSVIDYCANLDTKLLELRKELLCGEVEVGNYHYFKIFDPKERLICAAPFKQRVLHHALMNICHDNFEKFQIHHSYASRLNKGTYAGIKQAQVNQQKYRWFLKLDVRKYFYSIDQAVLKEMLDRRFKDKRLLHIFSSIIDSYNAVPGKGVPIGNLTSQYFANHYLAHADQFVKEKLGVPAYVRYMDDMVLWANDKELLLQFGKEFQRFINEFLLLTLKPFTLNSTLKGLPYCGYVLSKNTIHINQRSRKRFLKKLNIYNFKLNSLQWAQEEYQKHMLPLLAFTQKADSINFRKKYISETMIME